MFLTLILLLAIIGACEEKYLTHGCGGEGLLGTGRLVEKSRLLFSRGAGEVKGGQGAL